MQLVIYLYHHEMMYTNVQNRTARVDLWQPVEDVNILREYIKVVWHLEHPVNMVVERHTQATKWQDCMKELAKEIQTGK